VIDSEFSPDIEKVHNISKAARSGLFASKLNWFFSGKNPITPLTKKIIPSNLSCRIRKIALNSSLKEFQKPQMNPEIRKELIEYYKPYNDRLSELIERDLNHRNE